MLFQQGKFQTRFCLSSKEPYLPNTRNKMKLKQRRHNQNTANKSPLYAMVQQVKRTLVKNNPKKTTDSGNGNQQMKLLQARTRPPPGSLISLLPRSENAGRMSHKKQRHCKAAFRPNTARESGGRSCGEAVAGSPHGISPWPSCSTSDPAPR